MGVDAKIVSEMKDAFFTVAYVEQKVRDLNLKVTHVTDKEVRFLFHKRIVRIWPMTGRWSIEKHQQGRGFKNLLNIIKHVQW